MNIIFDFDGTLVDSFDCLVKLFNSLAKDHHLRPLDLQQINQLRHLNSKELIRRLNIPLYKMPKILYSARQSLYENITLLAPFNGIPYLLKQLAAVGYNLGIVSSNSEENIISWLQHHQLGNHFHFIHAGASFFGKKRILKKALFKNNIMDALYVGDETRDIAAARFANIYSVAVTWGFNSKEVLIRHNPHYIADTPQDILTIGLKHCQKLI